jgi:hypothetical protein
MPKARPRRWVVTLCAVLLGLSVIIGLGVWWVLRTTHELMAVSGDTATWQMKNIAASIERYRSRRGTIPRSLGELTTTNDGLNHPFMAQIPLDPWGQPFVYSVIDERKGRYEIVCGGDDRTIGTADDLYEPPRTSGR